MSAEQLDLFAASPAPALSASPDRPGRDGPADGKATDSTTPTEEILSPEAFRAELAAFNEFEKETAVLPFEDPSIPLTVYVNEFWTAKQRAAHGLHEISYRACFKPQLPRFFIQRLTRPGDRVYDPFMGRGTTLLEAALMGREVAGCDINPLSRILLGPRLAPPSDQAVTDRLDQLVLSGPEIEVPEDLLVFYHPDTLQHIARLRAYFLEREAAGTLDAVDAWIRMVATNRLTGHSVGYFSVYTLPPNQATSVTAQRRINAKRNQTPEVRDVRKIIARKSRSLIRDLTASESKQLHTAARDARLLTASCDATPALPDASVALVVTSPPFLDVVDYRGDNWLRSWFNGIDPDTVPIWNLRKAPVWTAAMHRVFREVHRVLRPGGHIAFEVGEVRKKSVLMENLVLEAAAHTGLEPELLLVNDQIFTKTANCWGVSNSSKGTNTNRIILLRKPG